MNHTELSEGGQDPAPLLSIVIPVYNRERFVGRAIQSCLNQADVDLEIVVVDDGSTDGTAQRVRSFVDRRIRLLTHVANRGVSPARNTAVFAARGKWIVLLDSDDEILPGGLAAITRRIEECNSDVAALRFMVRLDSGETSPVPSLSDETLDYEGYMRWAESCVGGRQETLLVIRRDTFAAVRFPEGRALEALYHLDFAQRFRSRSCPDFVRLYHHDAGDQLIRRSAKQVIRAASDEANSIELVLRHHGESLRRFAPKIYAMHASGLATLKFLAGDRGSGTRLVMREIVGAGFSLRLLIIFLLGILGAWPLAWFKTMRFRQAIP